MPENTKRLAIAYANLYSSIALDKDQELITDTKDIDSDDLLGTWHGLGMTPEKAHEYATQLGFPETLKEIQDMFNELTALVE